VRLFEVYNSISPYHEEKLEAKINSLDFVKYQAAEQNYLYQSILECLDIYHKESSVEKQISKLTNIGRVLANKKLEEQSVKILEKARTLAESHYKFAALVPIYELEKRKHFSQDTINADLLKQHYENIDHVLLRLQKSRVFQQIFDQLMLLRRQIGFVYSDEYLKKVQAIFPAELQLEPKEFSSFEEEVFFLLAKMEFYRMVHRGNEGFKFTTRLIELFENNLNNLTGVYIDHYIYALNVFIVHHMYKNEQEARETLKKVKGLDKVISKKDNNSYVQAKIFEVYYTCITDLALKNGRYQEIINNMDEINSSYRNLEKHMTPSFNLVLRSNLACVFFEGGLYKEALKWCHSVINDAPSLREDVYYIMRILYLLIHFELGNTLILPSLIQSTFRYLGKFKRILEFERLFLSHLKVLVDAHSKKEEKEAFLAFRKKIEPLQSKDYEKLVFNEIRIMDWVDRKIAGK
ncbi:MAG: hypothetical protein ACPF8V_09980, partial [Luteibaculum sp.]